MDSKAKVFSFFDQSALWFSMGVGLLVMQMGSFLVGAGGINATLAIVAGSIIGSGILGLVAAKGQQTGNNSAQLMIGTFGTNFAKLPIILNIIQLLGWTAFEFVVMSDGLIAILSKINPNLDASAVRMVLAVLLTGLVIYLLSKPMTGLVRKLVSKIALPLVIISLLWLTFQFYGKLGVGGITALFSSTGDGKTGFASALDLVIAMPISWLPLVADYSRFGKSRNTSLGGTFFGYLIANIWCYFLGLIIASAPNSSAEFVSSILLAQGGLVALGIILFDELDNAYGDAYSGSVSIGQLGISEKTGGKVLVGIAGFAAAFLPMHELESFLLILSSVFIPMFAVILAHEGQLKPKINWLNGVIWVFGIAIYQIIYNFYPQVGASLPSFAICWIAKTALDRLPQNVAG